MKKRNHFMKRPNPLWGKNKPRITFSGLGAFDWGALIGTAAQAYTGQPNALSTPKQIQQMPAQMFGPPSPTPVIIQQAPPQLNASKPFYKNPWVIGFAGVTVLGLGYVLVRGRRSRR